MGEVWRVPDPKLASAVKTGGTEFQFATPDGQRFLIGTLIGDTKVPPPTIILDWTALLKK